MISSFTANFSLSRFRTGVDATEAFEDVGHSDEARALLVDLHVGDFDKSSSVRTFQFFLIKPSCHLLDLTVLLLLGPQII